MQALVLSRIERSVDVEEGELAVAGLDDPSGAWRDVVHTRDGGELPDGHGRQTLAEGHSGASGGATLHWWRRSCWPGSMSTSVGSSTRSSPRATVSSRPTASILPTS